MLIASSGGNSKPFSRSNRARRANTRDIDTPRCRYSPTSKIYVRALHLSLSLGNASHGLCNAWFSTIASDQTLWKNQWQPSPQLGRERVPACVPTDLIHGY